jgi:hypothetical protein
MVFRVVLFLWEFLMDVLVVSRLSDEEKELEILLLRQQLRIVEGRQERGPQISRWQKVFDVKIRGTDQGCRIEETSSPD